MDRGVVLNDLELRKKNCIQLFVLILCSSNAPQCNNSTFRNISIQV